MGLLWRPRPVLTQALRSASASDFPPLILIIMGHPIPITDITGPIITVVMLGHHFIGPTAIASIIGIITDITGTITKPGNG